VINPFLAPKPPYDAARDLLPVTILAVSPMALVVSSELPVHSVRELLEYSRAKPGALNYASIGAGSPHELAAEWLKYSAKLDIVGIPYKGVAPALTAIATGEVQLMFTGLAAALPQERAGKIRLLAISGKARSRAAPNIPTIAEAGLPGFEFVAWYGVVAPAGTPQETISKLQEQLVNALSARSVADRYKDLGLEALAMTPAQFNNFLQEDTQLWERIIRSVHSRSR
jgi:tripartite-type tricarboxylate transporter receptor subunit TctC